MHAEASAVNNHSPHSPNLPQTQGYNLQRWYRWSSAQEQVNTGAAVIEPAKDN